LHGFGEGFGKVGSVGIGAVEVAVLRGAVGVEKAVVRLNSLCACGGLGHRCLVPSWMSKGQNKE